MPTEIELKARVNDSEALRAVLGERAEYLNQYTKEDCYWVSEKPREGGLQRLRVRKEERAFSGGAAESAVLVTCKNKNVADGVEINDELEFEVKRADAFEEFLRRTGFKPESAKRKRGWAFFREGINAELSEVEGLGWFIELEILADNSREETVAEAKNRLFGFLAEIGVDKSAIESRFYTEMLRE